MAPLGGVEEGEGILLRLIASLAAFLTMTACVDTATNQAVTAQNQAALAQARAAGAPIFITRVTTAFPNSAGGVDLYVDATNTSNKAIKYIDYDAQPYNAVEDSVSGTIRNRSVASARETGPIPINGSTNAGYWKNMWYNHSIRCAKLTEVKLTYMDGTVKTLRGQSIRDALAPRAYQAPCS